MTYIQIGIIYCLLAFVLDFYILKTKVLKLEAKLGKTAAQAAQEHKKHEEDLKRLNAMSSSDVAALFSESFKWYLLCTL